MVIKELPTFSAKIFLGLEEGYGGIVHTLDEVRLFCQNHCDVFQVGLNIQQVEFFYVGGNEPGVSIEFIQYPRFPRHPEEIREMAIELAEILITIFRQQRCTIVCTDKTILIERGQNGTESEY